MRYNNNAVMFNPENLTIEKMSNNNSKPLSPAEEAIRNWYLKQRRKRIAGQNDIASTDGAREKIKREMSGFSGLYSPEEIGQDIKTVLNLQASDSARDKSERGEILEEVVSAYGDLNGWFGDMTISRTLEYDDYINHADAVLSGHTSSGEEVFIAVDWTVSENKDILFKKSFLIDKSIQSGKLSEIKYFQSADDENDRRRLERIPRVVVAFQKENFQKLCEQAIKIINHEPGANKDFSESELQINVLDEIIGQLEYQFEYANQPGVMPPERSKEISVILKNALKKIEEIRSDKKSLMAEESGQEA